MTAALEGGEWSAARPGRNLPPRKTRYPFYRRLGGPQDRSGRMEKSRSQPDSIPDRPACSSVTILTELPGTLIAHNPPINMSTCRTMKTAKINVASKKKSSLHNQKKHSLFLTFTFSTKCWYECHLPFIYFSLYHKTEWNKNRLPVRTR